MRIMLPFFLLLFSTCVPASPLPTILVFGDSLSAGYGIDIDQSWPTLLQAKLKTQGYEYLVINASISGETTEGGSVRIGAALENFNPNLVILELGGNDGLRGFPPQIIKNNLRKIIQAAQANKASVVLLGIRIPPNYGVRYTQAFESVYRELATELSIPWIEFFMQDVALDQSLMQEDQIHPNAAAQPILLNNVWPVVSETLSK
ncbi:MAG: arylesterase [Woeseia sp.]|nr:arylesterase [Woeseia sp.]|tara:strand:- start:7357 stop:7968 length:612 start_codon:yes stop_codon:yes gene_type:complete